MSDTAQPDPVAQPAPQAAGGDAPAQPPPSAPPASTPPPATQPPVGESASEQPAYTTDDLLNVLRQQGMDDGAIAAAVRGEPPQAPPSETPPQSAPPAAETPEPQPPASSETPAAEGSDDAQPEPQPQQPAGAGSMRSPTADAPAALTPGQEYRSWVETKSYL